MAQSQVRKRPDARRAELLEAAEAEIRRSGFDGATAREITATAGVSLGLLHRYFASVPALLAAAFERAALADLATLADAAAAERDPVRALDTALTLYAPEGLDDVWQLWIGAWAAAPRHPEVRRTAARLTRAWVDTLAAVLERGREGGSFGCPDPQAAAWRLILLLDGLAVQVVALRTLSRADMRRLAAAAAEHEAGLPVGALSLDPGEGRP